MFVLYHRRSSFSPLKLQVIDTVTFKEVWLIFMPNEIDIARMKQRDYVKLLYKYCKEFLYLIKFRGFSRTYLKFRCIICGKEFKRDVNYVKNLKKLNTYPKCCSKKCLGKYINQLNPKKVRA